MSEGAQASNLMSAQEVAQRLGKSRKTVLRMAERGDLPFEHKLPGRTGSFLFSRPVVELYLRNRGTAA